MSLEELFDTNGWYLEEVDGELRYVSRDEKNRSVVAGRVKRHGGKRHLFARRPKRQPQTDADATVVLPTGDRVLIPKEGRWARRLKDREWHRAVQHAAVDVAMWGCMLSLTAIAMKAAYWVVAL